MTSYPSDLRYDKEHEWIRVEGDVAVIGISDFAQDQLGEVVYVDLPAVGDTVTSGETFGEVESVKSVSELFSPVSGEVVKVNDDLDGAPEAINEDAYGTGWMIEVKLADASELDGLMSSDEYQDFIASEA
ncbi:MAG: glycine cleavage system protein GcvH [Coriobacteriia bacterium]|nr:glycine cleavage system protein GcvH [Coriobacteriia bacterium]